MIKLSQEAEPQIYAPRGASGRFSRTSSSIRTRARSNLDDASLTENTRGSYPIDFIDNAELSGRGGHPKTSSC